MDKFISDFGNQMISSVEVKGMIFDVSDTYKICKKCSKQFSYKCDDETYKTIRQLCRCCGNMDLCMDCDKMSNTNK